MAELMNNMYAHDVLMVVYIYIYISMLAGRNCLQEHIANLINLLYYCVVCLICMYCINYLCTHALQTPRNATDGRRGRLAVIINSTKRNAERHPTQK
jgi:hypothetical protein